MLPRRLLPHIPDAWAAILLQEPVWMRACEHCSVIARYRINYRWGERYACAEHLALVCRELLVSLDIVIVRHHHRGWPV